MSNTSGKRVKEYYHDNGKVSYRATFNEKDNYQSYNGEPGSQSWAEDGSLIEECWFNDGVFTRENGPSKVRYYHNITVEEIWWNNRELSRIGGPAYMAAMNDGTLLTEEFWRDGVFLSGWELVRTIEFGKPNRIRKEVLKTPRPH